MEKVVIYRAAEVFLYLPIYIAEHTDVFKTKNLDIDIKFQTAGSDHLAIKNMIDNKYENSSHIPIALCDPMAIFANPHFSPFNQPENLKVIGTLIDKPPFWAVSIRDERFNTMEGAAKHFEAVICYRDNELITGYYIGTRMRDESGIEVIDKVGFRKEMDLLLNEAETSGKQCVAVTVDIIRLAQAQHSGKNVYLNYRFSEDCKNFGKFLTSCLITTAEVCENHSDTIADILEGIQRSIFMFRTSERIARDVCQVVNSQMLEKGDSLKDPLPLNNRDPDTKLEQWCDRELLDPIIENQESGRSWLIVDKANGKRYIAEKKEDQICLYESSDSLTEDDITWIVKQFHEENFYPNDLITRKDNWKESIDARSRVESWSELDKERYKEGYDHIVDNQFASKARDSIIEEISDISLQEEREKLKEVEENLATHKEKVKKDFATHKDEVEENFVKHKEVHRRITPFLLGSTFLLLLLLFWFSDLIDKLGLNKYEQIIKLGLSGLFGLVFIFRVVFWNKGWFYICAVVGGVIILGGAVYFFSGLVSSLIVTVIGGVTVLLISREIESRERKSDE